MSLLEVLMRGRLTQDLWTGQTVSTLVKRIFFRRVLESVPRRHEPMTDPEPESWIGCRQEKEEGRAWNSKDYCARYPICEDQEAKNKGGRLAEAEPVDTSVHNPVGNLRTQYLGSVT